MNKQLEDNFDSLSLEEIEAADACFESARTIQAHSLYFINTGEFYTEHALIREALNMFISDPMPELERYLDEITLSILHWIDWSKDYYKNFSDTDIKRPTRHERKLIAAEIIDHWTERKITKHINQLIGAIPR